MKLYPKSDLKNSDKIFDLLQESFGEKRSVPQLLKAFYDPRQREGETLRAFSQALRELQAKIEKKSVTKSSAKTRLFETTLPKMLEISPPSKGT